MKTHIHTKHLLHSHSSWLNGIVVIFGYFWLISGIDKIGSGVFVSVANFMAFFHEMMPHKKK